MQENQQIVWPISIHALRVEGDFDLFRHLQHLVAISIHALRVEGDQNMSYLHSYRPNFYPRPPGGGRRVAIAENNIELSISIHALRVEGDRRVQRLLNHSDISIHALRVEGDVTL